jgi:hypothetical protein
MDIYKELEDVKAPDWTGASKEPDKPKVNTALGDLFKDIAEIGGAAIGMFDRAQDASLEAGVRQEAEKITKDFTDSIPEVGTAVPPGDGTEPGVPTEGGADIAAPAAPVGATDITSQAQAAMDDPAVPQEVKNSVNHLEKTKNAALAKPSLEGHYYVQLEAAKAKWRAKYPGKAKEIDAMFSRVTGVNSANALWRTKLGDYEASIKAQQTAANKLETRYLESRKYMPGVSKDEYMRNPTYYDGQVGKVQQYEKSLDIQKNELALLDAKDKRSDEKATEFIRQFGSGKVSMAMGTTMKAIDSKRQALAAKGANVTPEERLAFRNEVDMAVTDLEQQIRTEAYRSEERTKDGKTEFAPSVVMRIGGEKLEKEISALTKPLRDVAALFEEGNENGFAKLAANSVKHQTNQIWQNMKTLYPKMAIAEVMKEKGGEVMAGAWMSQNKDLQDAMMKFGQNEAEVAAVLNGAIVLGTRTATPGSVVPFDEAAAKLTPEGKAKQLNTLIRQMTDDVNSPNPQHAANAIEFLFKEKTFFGTLDESSQQQLWAKMTAPGMYEKAKALGGEYTKYWTEWTERNAPAMLAREIDVAQKRIVEFNRYDVEFQPDTMQFSFRLNPEYEKKGLWGGSSTGRVSDMPRVLEQDANNALGGLNRALAPLVQGMKDTYGDKAPEKLMEMLRSKGFNLDAEKKGLPFDNLGSKLLKGIEKLLPDMSKPPTEAPMVPKYKGKEGGAKPLKALSLDESVEDLTASQTPVTKENADTGPWRNIVGEVTARYESGGKWESAGPDNIGWAYGRYQFNSKGSLNNFMKDNPAIAKEFAGLNPESRAFANKWRELAKTRGPEFAQAQQNSFIKHAQPSISAAQKSGFHTDDRGVMEAVLSGSIQHGKFPQVIRKAASAPGFDKLPPEQQIRALYNARAQYVAGLKTIDEGTRKAVLSRYKSEVKYALSFVGEDAGDPSKSNGVGRGKGRSMLAQRATGEEGQQAGEANPEEFTIDLNKNTLGAPMEAAANLARNADWDKFMAKARRSENVEDVRANSKTAKVPMDIVDEIQYVAQKARMGKLAKRPVVEQLRNLGMSDTAILDIMSADDDAPELKNANNRPKQKLKKKEEE